MGLMDYYNAQSDGSGDSALLGALAKYKPVEAPKSRQEVITNALQKLAADQQLGNGGIAGQIAQGLAGYASGSMQGQSADTLAAQQKMQQQAYGDIYNNLSQGKINEAIAGTNKYIQAGGDPKNLDRLKELFDSVVKPQTTLDAQGRPRFVGTSAAISGNMQSAPETRNMLSDQETARNNAVNNQLGQQRVGIEGANLGLRRQELQQGKTPSGYMPNPNGGLSYIPGGPADPTVKAAAKPLPSNASKQLSENNSAMSAIENALNVSAKTPDAFGLYGGLAGSTSLSNNMADINNVMGRASIADIGSKVIHDRSGAAVTMSEAPRLKPFIPSSYDSPEVIKTKLIQLRQKLGEENQGLLDTYDAQGYNISDKLKDLSTNKSNAPKAFTYNPSTKKFE